MVYIARDVEVAALTDSLVGATFADKYRIVRPIGRGGMGVVYEAQHIGLAKPVAIKLMLEKYAADPEAIARFQREALAASRIGNPHIIDVIDIGTAPDGRSFVVMELLNGAPLTEVLLGSGAMPPWRAVQIVRQVLRAVGAAHAKGIVHRDLKPDNIFLVNQDDHHDFVKLLDFGISKVLDPSQTVAATKLTTTGVVIGTPLYMAPEQAMGTVVDHRADLYACGVILYELLAGKPPFEGATYAVLVAKLLTATPPYLGDVRPGLPPALVTAVHRALEKEPARRFTSAELFAAALPGDRSPSLLELGGTLDSGQVRPVKLPSVAPRRWPWVAGAVATVATATAITWFAFSPSAREPRRDGVAAGSAAATVGASGTGEPAPGSGRGSAGSAVPAAAAASSHNPPVLAPAVVKTGTLDVKSNPPGATVTVDRQVVGTTPRTLSLTPGTHHLHVELAGHTTLDEDEEVREGERTSVVVALPSAPLGVTRPRPPIAQTTHTTGGVRSIAPRGSGASQPITATEPDHPTSPPHPDDTRPTPPGPNGTKPNPY